MSSILMGKNLQVSVFGQSHSKAIGAVADGLPAGFHVDEEKVRNFLARRAPGNAKFSTPRREKDIPVTLSGLVDGVTCGAPLGVMLENTDTRAQDYENLRLTPRPGHADYTAAVRYKGFNDIAGGGHFSGRLTAPLCYVGAICLQILAEKGVSVRAHIASVADICDTPFDPVNVQTDNVEAKAFPVLADAQGKKMQAVIEAARLDGDSVGGVIECAVLGLPAGLGDPMFDGVENQLAKNLFAIPAVKGVEFGSGFAGTALRGSENNDAFCIPNNGKICTETNNHGGILGGITSGMPVVFRVAIKPTPSIAKPQKSVNLQEKAETSLEIVGRHDPCIVPRAVPVVEAIAAITALDLLLGA